MLLPWVSALCYGGTGPYVAVRLREQGETMLTGDEVYYGVGPVPTSFHLAARKGWLEQAFRRCGARLINLGDIPLMQEKHYTHRSPNLIRLGGNFPPFWARAGGADTLLVSMSCLPMRVSMVARSGFNMRRGTRGARLAVPVRPAWPVDFFRLGARLMERGLSSWAGLSDTGFSHVPVEGLCDYSWWEGVTMFLSRPRADFSGTLEAERKALMSGAADIVVFTQGRGLPMLKNGKFKELFAVPGDAPWRFLRTNSFPVVTTVSRDLARRRPELVVLWIKMEILAARWAAANQRDFLETLSGCNGIPPDALKDACRPDMAAYFEPGFSAESLELLRMIRDFLSEEKVIPESFDLDGWVDTSFWEQALNELK